MGFENELRLPMFTSIEIVQDIERFLDLLKNCQNIAEFLWDDDQRQDLFDRLLKHCAVQKQTLSNPLSDQGFIFRLKNLIHLFLFYIIDAGTVRRL